MVPLIFAGLLPVPILAQDATTNTPPPAVLSAAAAISDKEATEERFKRVEADLESLKSDNALLQKKVASLEEKNGSLRDDLAKAMSSAVSADDLKHLADKITEVDKNRQADKEVILEQIKKSIETIQKMLASNAGAAGAPHPRLPPPGPEPQLSDKGFPYAIKLHDTFTSVLKDANEQFKAKGWKPITLQQLQEANPGVNPSTLIVGQKIMIPMPPGSN